MTTDKKKSNALELRGLELGLEPQIADEDVLKMDDIPEEGLLLHIQRPASWLDVDVPVTSGVDAWLLLHKINRDVTVEVEGDCTIELECSRCLKAISFPVPMEFRTMFLPVKDVEAADDTELVDDDLGVTFYRKAEIAWNDVFREEVILAIPLKPLCSPDCPGLCATCGADLSAGDCGCKPAAGDPRFSALSGLLESLRKEQPDTN